MFVVMQAKATEEDVRAVCQKIEILGLRSHISAGAQRFGIAVIGEIGELDTAVFEELAGVQEVLRISKRYKLVSREVRPENTVIHFPGSPATIGGREVAVIAGPCAVETAEQVFGVAEQIARMGVMFFRAGAFKPRTSPYSFQGLGLEGLRLLAEVRGRFGLLIVTEAVNEASLDLVEQYADVIQIGARNMQNYSLLKRAGQARKPVLLKRGLSATLEEFLLAAEYVMSEGNPQVILCERGVRTFADHSRNTLDLSIVPAIQRESHLPILVDPSHGTGKRNKVIPLSRAAVAVGCDGLMLEVHDNPDQARSDGAQSIFPAQLEELLRQVRPIAEVLDRTIAGGSPEQQQPLAETRLSPTATIRAGFRPMNGKQCLETAPLKKLEWGTSRSTHLCQLRANRSTRRRGNETIPLCQQRAKAWGTRTHGATTHRASSRWGDSLGGDLRAACRVGVPEGDGCDARIRLCKQQQERHGDGDRYRHVCAVANAERGQESDGSDAESGERRSLRGELGFGLGERDRRAQQSTAGDDGGAAKPVLRLR